MGWAPWGRRQSGLQQPEVDLDGPGGADLDRVEAGVTGIDEVVPFLGDDCAV